MTRDRTYGYFIEKDSNCARTMLRALNDEYCPDMPGDSAKLVGGFGGGMGYGKAYDAPCGGYSTISYRLIHERAHATPELKPVVAALAEEFMERFGSDARYKLVGACRKKNTRCLDMICVAAGITDACSERIISEEREQDK